MSARGIGILIFPILLSLIFAGCSHSHDKHHDELTPFIAQIKKGQEKARSLVLQIKAFKQIVQNDDRTNQAYELYEAAMSQNNVCIEELTNEIVNNTNPADDQAFKKCIDKANHSTIAFLNFGKNLINPPTQSLNNAMRASPLGGAFLGHTNVTAPNSLGGISFEIIHGFLDAAIDLWKAIKDENRKDRMAEASFLSKELTWPTWEQIK